MENIIDPEDLDKWREAGKLASKALLYGKGLIKKGAVIREILDKVEDKIAALGAAPSFPPQMSSNEIAAHYCPKEDDEDVLGDHIVSIDVGVHIDGCQGDNALSVDLTGKYGDLVKASEEALQAAIEVCAPGVKVSEVGAAVEKAITARGFEPIRNLSGHGLSLYQIHTSPTLPNYDNKSQDKLAKGMVIAIEPFASTGIGLIHEKGIATVFSQVKRAGARSTYAKAILKQINYLNGLPFTTRWLTKKIGVGQVKMGMNELIRNRIIHQYPPLVEKSNGITSQAEKTMYIGDEVEVLTVR